MAYVKGTNGNDILDTADGVTNGSDLIYGYDGNDSIYGLGGDDTIFGGAGADAINGGAGTDTAVYADSNEGVVIGLGFAVAHGGTAEGDTLVSIENLIGSAYSDWLVGDDGSNLLKGGGGADQLAGGGGNDVLKGGGGADVLLGSAGIDTADYSDSSVGVDINLLAPTNGHYGTAEGDVLVGIENITGSAYNDGMLGDYGANVLSGGAGDDSLHGFDGSDILYGGDGNDTLDGGANFTSLPLGLIAPGPDTMLGGTGNDTYVVDYSTDVVTETIGQGTDHVKTYVSYALAAGTEVEFLETTGGSSSIDLVGNEFANTIVGNDGVNNIIGGLGKDNLTGNGGGDTFSWTSTAETGYGETEADTITDFNRSQGDRIALNPIDADTTAAGDQAFAFIGNAPLTAPGQISYFNNGTDTFILLNTDADTDHEAAIRVMGIHTVDVGWFAL